MNTKRMKGFTLAELLIVMAIIVVLAAVAIPTFGRQLETSRETGDMELIRSAYTEALSYAVLDAADGILDGKNGGTNLGGNEPLTAIPTAKANLTAAVLAVPDTTDAGKKCTYVVTLEKMDTAAKIKQTGTGWQYVNNQILGQTVEDVVTQKGTTTPYTQAVCFSFVMNTGVGDGNVRLSEYSAAVPNTAETDQPSNAVDAVGIHVLNMTD